MMRRWICCMVFATLAVVSQAVDIPVVKGGASKSPLSLAGMRAEDGNGTRCLKIIENDLQRSGWFRIGSATKGCIVITGRCGSGGGRLLVECTVQDTASGRTYLRKTYREDLGALRRTAHRVADDIVWAVKRKPGIASTRIVMISSQQGRKDLYMCAADGYDVVRLTKDGAVCLSPDWGPDARMLVYTSFHQGYPDVYSIDLRTNRRSRLVGYPGLNAGAEISPDGRFLALTLSKDGNPDLYIKELRGSTLRRLTKTRYAAEASPSWSPDGSKIVFVSDRSGSPHLYTMPSAGGKEARLTFHGSENVSPDWGPDGRIAWSSRRGGRYHICVMDPSDRRETQLTSEYVDHEDPSWAPDGRHIAYTRSSGYRSEVYILDTMGDPQIRLTASPGDWYSPAWSPE